jgi:phage protein U
MMLGNFGSIVFETSDKRILTFSGLKIDSAARYGSHEIIGKKPRTEYVGPGLLSLSFTINLNGKLGVKPSDEMQKWLTLAKTGQAEYLMINDQLLGDDRWCVKSVSEAWDTILNGGELYSGKIDVTLEEYISEV